ncbi:hypothetical protein ILUMI_27346 [Ignelater luminosus]|uniref:Uncharacterized protein n=1 Tax=Ignelater luminosus TaxID=2038154 RepID=A0A8K0C532_IGNLU|nr:hypothetical protein ILUMI_27346 [Ignelater luminosus]
MGNILLRGTRIVIPVSLRQLVLKLVQESYSSMVKMKEILRTRSVLVQQPKLDKFTTVFQNTPYKVVNRRGTQVEVMSPEGVCYIRNTSKLKKYYGNNDDIRVTQASEKTHHEDLQVKHGPIRRESSMEPKKEGNEKEKILLSTRSPVRSGSHLSITRQPQNGYESKCSVLE